MFLWGSGIPSRFMFLHCVIPAPQLPAAKKKKKNQTILASVCMTPGQQVKGNLIHSIHEYSLEIYHKLGTAGVLGIQRRQRQGHCA